MMNKHKIYWPFKKSITWRNKQEWEVFINESNQDRISPEALHLLSTMLVIDFVRNYDYKLMLNLDLGR